MLEVYLHVYSMMCVVCEKVFERPYFAILVYIFLVAYYSATVHLPVGSLHSSGIIVVYDLLTLSV